MQKIISLIKVSLNHDMNLFKINTKKQSKVYKIIPIILALYITVYIGALSSYMMSKVQNVHLEFTILTLFTLIVSVITFIEGIYKSSSLLFNCKDDNLMFSLPIKKSTVLLIRILKFYIFEFIYNSLFIIPVMIVYAIKINPGWNYYLGSILALFILPILPIVLSCIIGFVIAFLSSKFQGKNLVQTIITMILLLGILYISYNINGFIADLAKKASNMNDLITRLYFPVGEYIKIITDFDIKTLFLFIVGHISIFGFILLLLGKVYFNINSNFKRELISHKNNNYKITNNSQRKAFIKKEINRFVTTPVYITNAGFGLVLYIVACIGMGFKYDSLVKAIANSDIGININALQGYFPLLIFGLVCFASFMTSITSSMISLEGKSFNILKSLPIDSFKILLYKILAALVIMVPCLIIGNIIVFIKFKFSILNIILILIASLICPFLSELIGILANLKYPKLDATNDTEVVKQSMSSMVAVFGGLGILAISVMILIKLAKLSLSNSLIISIMLGIYLVACIVLWFVLVKTSEKSFKNIGV